MAHDEITAYHACKIRTHLLDVRDEHLQTCELCDAPDVPVLPSGDIQVGYCERLDELETMIGRWTVKAVALLGKQGVL